jgi:hypothetical protein
MAELIAPPSNTPLAPVVPNQPTSQQVAPVVTPPPENVAVTTPAADSGQGVGFKDLPKPLQEIGLAAQKGNTVAVSDLINQTNKETENYHINTKPQWGKVFISLISRNYGDAYKYFNGGATKDEIAKTPTGDEVIKVFNEFGDTGIYKDRKTGKELTPDQIKELNKRGGAISASDKLALETATWKNAQLTAQEANKGNASQLQAAQKMAYAAARTASSANNNFEEQINLAKRIPHVLNYFGNLPSAERQQLLGYINRYNTTNASTQKSGEKAGGVSTGATQNTNLGAGGKLGASNEGGTIVGNVGAQGGVAAGNQFNINERELNAASAANSKTAQDQQNLQSIIQQKMQKVIANGDEFRDFMRIQALNAANEVALSQIPNDVKPIGWTNMITTDPYLGGANAMITNASVGQRNNALLAAWTAEIYKAQNKAATTGVQENMGDLQKRFETSDLFKAINNTHTDREEIHLNKPRSRKKGDLLVDRQHNIYQAD